MPLSCPPVPCCPALWPCSALAWLPCPAPCCCCPACPQHPSATTSPLPLPLARLSSVLSAPDPNTDTGEVPLTPPLLICSVSTRHQKFRLCLFVPRKTPAWNTPPASTLPKNFLSKNPACVAGSIRAAGDGSGGPLAAAQGYPLPLGASSRGRGSAVAGLRAVDLPWLMSWSTSQGAGVPGGQVQPGEGRRHPCRFLPACCSWRQHRPVPHHRHLKSSSPRMSVPDKEIKSGIFPGKVIIVEHSK